MYLFPMYTCTHTSKCIGIHVHTYVHACRHTYTNSYMHVYRHTYNAYIRSNDRIYSDRAVLDIICIQDCSIHCTQAMYLGLYMSQNRRVDYTHKKAIHPQQDWTASWRGPIQYDIDLLLELAQLDQHFRCSCVVSLQRLERNGPCVYDSTAEA